MPPNTDTYYMGWWAVADGMIAAVCRWRCLSSGCCGLLCPCCVPAVWHAVMAGRRRYCECEPVESPRATLGMSAVVAAAVSCRAANATLHRRCLLADSAVAIALD